MRMRYICLHFIPTYSLQQSDVRPGVCGQCVYVTGLSAS